MSNYIFLSQHNIIINIGSLRDKESEVSLAIPMTMNLKVGQDQDHVIGEGVTREDAGAHRVQVI